MTLALIGVPAPVLAVVDGIPTTTSVDVARHFGKRHDDVLKAIRNLLPQLPDGGVRNFAETPYTDPQNGQQYPAYRITRDGFTLLAMGFTGKKALAFKLAYIDAFNRMEAELAKPAHDPERLQMAYRLATEVAATVQRTVFDAVMAGRDEWRDTRYMFCLNFDNRRPTANQHAPTVPWAKPLAADTMVTSFDQLIGTKPNTESQLPSASNQQLADLATACTQVLSRRLGAVNRRNT